jgi:hypothetical protein
VNVAAFGSRDELGVKTGILRPYGAQEITAPSKRDWLPEVLRVGRYGKMFGPDILSRRNPHLCLERHRVFVVADQWIDPDLDNFRPIHEKLGYAGQDRGDGMKIGSGAIARSSEDLSKGRTSEHLMGERRVERNQADRGAEGGYVASSS